MNLNISEIILLVVLAVIIFGPDKLPDVARKAARLLKFLRGVANNAQDTVRRELGPEYADLQLSDLQPKNLARKLLAEDYETIENEIRGVKDDVAHLRSEVKATTSEIDADITGAVAETRLRLADDAAKVAETPVLVTDGGARVRWDDEAT